MILSDDERIRDRHLTDNPSSNRRCCRRKARRRRRRKLAGANNRIRDRVASDWRVGSSRSGGLNGRGESCAYPKLSDSRSSARRAPVVPRVAAHVPSREKPTTDCQRSSSVPDRGGAGGCGRWERCEVRGKVDGGGMVVRGHSRPLEKERRDGRRAKTRARGDSRCWYADVKLRFSVRSSSTRVRRVSLVSLPPCFSHDIKSDSSRKPTLG